MALRERTIPNSPLERISEQRIKEYFSENKSFSFKDSKNSSGSSGKFMIHFKKGKSQSDGVGTSKMTINVNRKKIFCLLKDEKDFFRSIRSYNYYENLKNKLKQLEKKASLNSINFQQKEKFNLDNNIDPNSLKISDEDNDFVYVAGLSGNQNANQNPKTDYRRAGTTNDKQYYNKLFNHFYCGEIQKELLKSATIVSKPNANANSHENLIVNTTDPILDRMKCNDDNINTSIFHHLKDKVNHSGIEEEKNNTNNSNSECKLLFPLGYSICELCDLLIPKKLMITLSPCQHSFCTRCGKNFYEDIIETGDVNNLTCPYYNCKTPLSVATLINLVSEKLMSRYYRLFNKSLLSVESLKKDTIHLNNNTTTKNLSTYFSTIQDYNKKHVIDVNQNEDMYYLYHKYKDNFCQVCNLPSLFGKNCKNTLKCLNCMGRFCKFCLQKIDTPDHFNTFNERNCCKNYLKFYREQMRPKDNHKEIRNFCLRFFFFLVSYFFAIMISVFYIKKICDFIFCKDDHETNPLFMHVKKKVSKFNSNITITKFRLATTSSNASKKKEKARNKCVHYTFIDGPKYFVNFILLLVWIPVLILIIPYFPMISCFFF